MTIPRRLKPLPPRKGGHLPAPQAAQPFQRA